MKFNNKTLKEAVNDWLGDATKAEAKYGHISNWDVSEVTEMTGLFYPKYSDNESKLDQSKFNENIGRWDTSNVTRMSNMFCYAESFNQDIGNWDVSKVTNMSYMFESASSFNQDIGDWDVSQVTDMSHMFIEAESFNQDINKWDVRNVIYMSHMFKRASSFNKANIDTWLTPSHIKKEDMFDRVKISIDKTTFSEKNLINMSTTSIEDLLKILKTKDNLIVLKLTHEIEGFVQYNSKESEPVRSPSKREEIINKSENYQQYLNDGHEGAFYYAEGAQKFDSNKNIFGACFFIDAEIICKKDFLIECIDYYIEWAIEEDVLPLWEGFIEDEDFSTGSCIDEEIGEFMLFANEINNDESDNFLQFLSVKIKDDVVWAFDENNGSTISFDFKIYIK